MQAGTIDPVQSSQTQSAIDDVVYKSSEGGQRRFL
jgi:hypothetical protein